MTPFALSADKISATTRESTPDTSNQCPDCGSALGPDYVRVFSPTGRAADLDGCPHCPPRPATAGETESATDERTVLLREVRADE